VGNESFEFTFYHTIAAVAAVVLVAAVVERRLVSGAEPSRNQLVEGNDD
jgi:hypothetical protein